MALPATPTATLFARYRVADASGLTEGGQITSVPDTSGNNHPVLTQSTSSRRPLARQVTNNGKTFWAADFDGADDCLLGSGTARDALRNVSGATVFVVSCNDAILSGNRQHFFLSSGTSGTVARLSMQTNGTSVSEQTGARRLDSNPVNLLSSPGTAQTNVWTARMSVLYYSSAWHYHFKNGSLLVYNENFQTPGTTSNTAAVGIGIGARSDGAAEWASVRIAEVLIYHGAMSMADRASVHSYIQDTYGVSVADYVPSIQPGFYLWDGTEEQDLNMAGTWNGSTLINTTYTVT